MVLSQRRPATSPERIARRSFDLREKRLYDQLDEVERFVVKRLKTVMSEARDH
jgi:hypothetical protein